MKYYVNRENISLLFSLGSGSQGKVYYTRSGAVKIYHTPEIANSFFERDYLLTKVDSKNIVLGDTLVYDHDHQYRGYKMRTVLPSMFSQGSIAQLPKKDLVSKIIAVEQNASKFAKDGIFLDDIDKDHICYNGDLYVYDQGYYRVLPVESSKYPRRIIELNNYRILDSGIYNYLVNKSLVPKKVKKLHEVVSFSSLDCYKEHESLGCFLNSEMHSKENISQFIKRGGFR